MNVSGINRNFAEKKRKMIMEEKRYPSNNFGGVDFGNAKSVDELCEVLERIDETRNDPSQWGTFSEMMSDFQKEHSEWFR